MNNLNSKIRNISIMLKSMIVINIILLLKSIEPIHVDNNTDFVPGKNDNVVATPIIDERILNWIDIYESDDVMKFCDDINNHIDEIKTKLKTNYSDFNTQDNEEIKKAIQKFRDELNKVEVDDDHIFEIKKDILEDQNCKIKGIKEPIKHIKDKINVIINDNNNNEYEKIKNSWKLYCKNEIQNFQKELLKEDYEFKKDHIDYFRKEYISIKYETDFYSDDGSNKVDSLKLFDKIIANKEIINEINHNELKNWSLRCNIDKIIIDENLGDERLDEFVGEILQFEYEKDDNCNLKKTESNDKLIAYLENYSSEFLNPTRQTYEEAILIYQNNYKRGNKIITLTDDEIKKIFIDSDICRYTEVSDDVYKSEIQDIVETKYENDTSDQYILPDKWKSICILYNKYDYYNSKFSEDVKLNFSIIKSIIELFVKTNFENGEINIDENEENIDKIKKDIIKTHKLNNQEQINLVECEIKKIYNLEITLDNSILESMIKTIGLNFPFDDLCSISEPDETFSEYKEIKEEITSEEIEREMIDEKYIIYLLYQIYTQDNQIVDQEIIKNIIYSKYIDIHKCKYIKNKKNIFDRTYTFVDNPNIVIKWKYACYLLRYINKFDNGYNNFLVNNIESIINVYMEISTKTNNDINKYIENDRAQKIINNDILNEFLFKCKINYFIINKFIEDESIIDVFGINMIFDFPFKYQANISKPTKKEISQLKIKLKTINDTLLNLEYIVNKDTLLEDYIYIFHYLYNKSPKINLDNLNKLISELTFNNEKCKYIIEENNNIKEHIISKIKDIHDIENITKYKYAREIFYILTNKNIKNGDEDFIKRQIITIILNKLSISNVEVNIRNIENEIMENEKIKKEINGNDQIKSNVLCLFKRISAYKFFSDKVKRNELSRVLFHEIPLNDECEIDMEITKVKEIIEQILKNEIYRELTDYEKSDIYHLYVSYYNSVNEKLYNNKWNNILYELIVNSEECKIKPDINEIKNKLFDKIYESYSDNNDNTLQNVLHDVCRSQKLIDYYTSKDINNFYLPKDIRIAIIREYIYIKYYSGSQRQMDTQININEILFNKIQNDTIFAEYLKVNKIENLITCYINNVISNEIINEDDKLRKTINILSHSYLPDNPECTFFEFTEEDLIIMRDVLKASNIFTINNEMSYQIAIELFEVYYKISNITIVDSLFKIFANAMIDSSECKIRNHNDEYTKNIIVDIINQNRKDFDNKNDEELIKVTCILKQREKYYKILLGNDSSLPDKTKSQIFSLYLKYKESYDSEIQRIEKVKSFLNKIKDAQEIKSLMEKSEIYETMIYCEANSIYKKSDKKKNTGIIFGVTFSIVLIILIIAATLFIASKKRLFNRK